MNSHQIRLQGSFEIPEPIEIDQDYSLSFTGGVTTIAKHSEENGDFNYIYTVKAQAGGVLANKGKTVKFVKKGSQSQKLRYEILSRDLEYEAVMSYIITNLDEILLTGNFN